MLGSCSSLLMPSQVQKSLTLDSTTSTSIQNPQQASSESELKRKANQSQFIFISFQLIHLFSFFFRFSLFVQRIQRETKNRFETKISGFPTKGKITKQINAKIQSNGEKNKGKENLTAWGSMYLLENLLLRVCAKSKHVQVKRIDTHKYI